MKPIYLESDEEITSVIDKITEAGDQNIALVVAKNSNLLQSLINLKLLAKKATELNIELSIITNNKIGQKLARQVGLNSYSSLGSVGQTTNIKDDQPVTKKPESEKTADEVIDGVPIHLYTPGIKVSPVNQDNEVTKDEPKPEFKQSKLESDEQIEEDNQDLEEVPEKNIEEKKPELAKDVESIEESVTPENDLPAIVTRDRGSVTHNRLENIVVPWKAILIAVGLFATVSILGFFFLPRSEVTLTLPAKPVSITETLLVTLEQRELSGNEIAGVLLTVQKSATREFTATGKRDVGTRAAGNISIRNCEDTSSHSLARGSRVISSERVFLTNAVAVIPAGQFSAGGRVCNSVTVSVAVTAELPGENYNLSGAQFQIPSLRGNFTATGTTSGGQTRQITVLSQEDLTKVAEETKKQLLEEATKELNGKIGDNMILDGSLWYKLEQESSSKEVGAQTETANYTVNYTFNVISFNLSEIKSYAKTLLLKDSEPGSELMFDGEFLPQITFVQHIENKTGFNATVAGSGFLVKKIDRKVVAESIAGKRNSQATEVLKRDFQAKEVKIETSPKWWLDRLPTLSQNIAIGYGFTEEGKKE